MAHEATKTFSEVFQVILSFCEQDGRAALMDGGDDVLDDTAVSGVVIRQHPVDLLDAGSCARSNQAESAIAHDESVIKRPVRGLASGVHPEANGAQLHLGDGLMSVAPLRCRGEPNDVARLHLGEYPLERDRWQMVALIDDDVPIVSDQIVDLILANQALDHGDVESTVGPALATSDSANLLLVDIEENRKLGNPLFEERLAVDENKSAASAPRDKVRAEDGLPDLGRRHENTRFVLQERSSHLLLGDGHLL